MRTVLFFLLTGVMAVPGALAQRQAPTPAPAPVATPSAAPGGSAEPSDQVIAKIIARETEEMGVIRKYSPLVETYVQQTKGDPQEGWLPNGDRYFLGHANFANGLGLEPIAPRNTNVVHWTLGQMNKVFGFATEFLPRGFLQMIYVDSAGLNTQNYHFEYVRREFLGEVRTLVFDVTPIGRNNKGRFVGRIWADDVSFTIVRFNGTYASGRKLTNNFDFDSWRVNAGPNLWLPEFIYSEEQAPKFGTGSTIHFKAQTRLWGYNVGRSRQEEELSTVLVEANAPIEDKSAQDNDLSPLQEKREWERQAANNVINELQKIGLIAPAGEVDKVLATVTNNLEVTNHVDLEPEVDCRVLMTSTIESFTVGRTIVMSRGLIDVLPDEASLAAMVAKELAYILLDRAPDTRFGFYYRLLQLDEKKTFQHFDFARSKEDDAAASAKAAELLANSPYKDQLRIARLFVAELQKRSKEIPNLISPRLGDATLAGASVSANAEDSAAPNEIVALPLGGRVKLDPWNDDLELLKTQPVRNLAEREKMPFEVTPFMPYLTREADNNPKAAQGSE